MKVCHFLIGLFSFCIQSFAVQVWAKDSDQFLRVRLQKQISSFTITGRSLSIQGEAKVLQKVAIPKEIETYTISRVQTKDKYLWKVETKTGEVKYYGASYLTVRGLNIYSKGSALPEKFFFTGNENFDLIGIVSLQSYLMGVVANEMPLSWPLEAQKAQAIAARSYALAVSEERKNKIFQLESTTMDQVFSHIGKTSLDQPQMDSVFMAVVQTDGQILLNKENKITKTFYHADCGGSTSSSQAVFGTNELTANVVDAGCPLNPRAKWSLQLSKDFIAKKISDYLHISSGLLSAFNLNMHLVFKDRRVSEIQFPLGDGRARSISAMQFRNLIGNKQLKSARFSIKEVDESIIFEGAGFGHGVGLCQWGSKYMAKGGAKYKEILQHYYPTLILKSAEDLRSEEADRKQYHPVFNSHG